ncbi:hypothetical protein VTK26DRAFT_6571 [Humicola hyalothermophila]
MPATEIITIINNSGKVISTGKHLVSIFKEAQAAYKDRKDAVKAERAGIRRAKTFDVAPHGDAYYDDGYHGRYGDEVDYAYDRRSLREESFSRRRSHDDGDDGRSHASSRFSRRSRRSRRPHSPSQERSGPLALTEANLKTHSEVSATSLSKAYRSPYAETAPRDVQLSRPTLAIAGLPPPSESAHPPPASGALVPAPAADRQQMVRRRRSDPSLTKKDSIDMDMAYGEVPPDLESRVDLDPADDKGRADADHPVKPEDPQEAEALGLLDRIENFLEEAQCVHQTASSMIESLQRNPEAAAAVALSLAELSSLIGKMSPAFLAFLKGGSPAVFALLASPQFLIGAGVAAGVTIVMFGGWKIVKRIAGAATPAAKTLEAPLEGRPLAQPAPPSTGEKALPSPPASYDEALVLRDVEELSSIETWRRGIVPFGADESADIELMSREAERALREQYRSTVGGGEDLDDEVDPSDSVSQVKSVRSYRSSRSRRSHRSSASKRYREFYEAEERRKSGSGRKEKEKEKERDREKEKDRDGAASEAASERSHRSHRSHRSSKDRDREDKSTVSRSSKHRDGESVVSKSSKYSSSKIGLKVIEEGGEDDEHGGDGESGAGGKPKEKKRDMIKQLFKMKKDREDRERAVSVLV